ncbi:hypothetical protein FB451DRAFT_1054541 [Mycena latifolia]|nr:hypothetical protein FB451DRAFT_1054541 [Mycena latifolia]
MKVLQTSLLFAASVYHWSFCNADTPPPTFQADGAPFKSPVTTASGFSARVLFSNLTSPRGIALDGEENILVVERGFGVTAFSPTNGGWERQVVVSNPNFMQGIQVAGHLLYSWGQSNTAYLGCMGKVIRAVGGSLLETCKCISASIERQMKGLARAEFLNSRKFEKLT